jgi:hypothetical protein
MNITILNVAISTMPAKKQGGKPYQLAEVAFKNNSFGGAVSGKKITSYSKAYQAVAEAQPGETFDVTTEKNGEFVEWVSLTKAGAGSVSPVVQQGKVPQSTGTQTTASPRSTYETPEERAKKQVYIVRQSSLSTAADLLSVGAKSPPAVDQVIETAKKLEAYVFGIQKLGGSTGFDDIPDLDPVFTDPQID